MSIYMIEKDRGVFDVSELSLPVVAQWAFITGFQKVIGYFCIRNIAWDLS